MMSHKSDCHCGHCISARVVIPEKSITEKIKDASIKPEDLMWHLEATEREIAEYYTASATAMNRIRAIQNIVRLLLIERDTPTPKQADGITTSNTRIGGDSADSPKPDGFANSQDVSGNGGKRKGA